MQLSTFTSLFHRSSALALLFHFFYFVFSCSKPQTTFYAGAVGAIFVVAGIIGAVALPIISDKLGVRTPLFVGALSILVPLFLGLTFISSFLFICIVAGFTGFVIMGVAPVLFQCSSEVAYPIKEGTSLGVILLMGQISGAVFVYVFEAASGSSGSVILPMLFIVAITALEIPFTLRMKESTLANKN